jgi:lipopolysaccharide/colanic/teichoic acid biosynthesis glycosyltransferase
LSAELLEQNPSNSAHTEFEQGGLFLRKKPLGGRASGYTCPDSAVGHRSFISRETSSFLTQIGQEETGVFQRQAPVHTAWKGLSPWSRSAAKRLFDCACVLLALPVLLPLMLAIAAAVRLTSPGPVLFLQKRMSRYGRTFTILKFRTMVHVAGAAHHPITTSNNQRFTPIGPFLRRWKLDELPQLANVLGGHMSLVGPRPKLPEYVTLELPCRPGITGMATIVFAREEKILVRVAKEHLDAYIHAVVLPAKQQLDVEYMARATFLSDLRLLVNTLLRRWDTAALEKISGLADFATGHEGTGWRAFPPAPASARRLIAQSADRPVTAEQASAF